MIGVLLRLLTNKPLTPIEDVDGIWTLVDRDDDGKITYQCTRMSSLFKTVHPSGVVEFSDCDRTVGVTDSDKDPEGISWSGSKAYRWVDAKWPITMPYMPADVPYKVYFHNDDDTVPYKIVEPDGTTHFPMD
jgi:hypothetical protein